MNFHGSKEDRLQRETFHGSRRGNTADEGCSDGRGIKRRRRGIRGLWRGSGSERVRMAHNILRNVVSDLRNGVSDLRDGVSDLRDEVSDLRNGIPDLRD